MEIIEAYRKASGMIPENVHITGCTDIGVSYVFSTNLKGEEQIAPGSVLIQVWKKDGTVGYYDDSPDPSKEDPFENISRLIDGKEIDLSELIM